MVFGRDTVGGFRDFGDEANALAGERADHELRRTVVTKRSANNIDPRG
jgi:hypothetical protein